MAFDTGPRLQIGEGERPPALVVAVQLPGVDDQELASSLEELERLATTLGLQPIGRIVQRRAKLASGIVLGEGKLAELAEWTGGSGVVEAYVKPGGRRATERNEAELDADDDGDDDGDAHEVDPDDVGSDGRPKDAPRARVVLVDHDLTPTQQRNLEKATGVDVLDRTSVILEIFHRHARTREARLQVEIARLKYLAPRLRESGGGGDRVRGGIGGKGAGESTMELDRRRIRDRIAELRHELAQIEGSSQTRRGRRSELPTVAIVGYTNAGKSSLMRMLTSSEVYVADKLFATLDTTVRRLVPPTEPPILVSDTVGFIKKLPHDLVASFRSTLDEAADADLLLHVVDASDPAMPDQLAVTREVLGDVFAKTGADEVTSWLLLNKIDRVDEAGREALRQRYPRAIQLSARDRADIAGLRDRLIGELIGALEDAQLVVPWAKAKLSHVIHERTTVVTETHDDDGTTYQVRAPASVLAQIRADLDA